VQGLHRLTRFREATAGIEMRTTLNRSPDTSWLVQLGEHDDWLSAGDLDWLRSATNTGLDLRIYEGGDHELALEEAQRERVAWLRHRLTEASSP